jgi:FdhD protein
MLPRTRANRSRNRFMNQTTRTIEVSRWSGQTITETATDAVVAEEPLEIRLGDATLVVTMRTPGHDEELAAGLLYTEGVVERIDDIVSIERVRPPDDESHSPNTVSVALQPDARVDLTPMQRCTYASSSCGVCGTASIEHVLRSVEPIRGGFLTGADTLHRLPETMRSAQEVFSTTGGSHAAGLFDAKGNLLCLREDVGRHNAVDKVVGWGVLEKRLPFGDCILLTSGRSSFEIVHKALTARIPVVASVSAATSLAVEMAGAGNQTLVGFLRHGTMTVYCGADRIDQQRVSEQSAT